MFLYFQIDEKRMILVLMYSRWVSKKRDVNETARSMVRSKRVSHSYRKRYSVNWGKLTEETCVVGKRTSCYSILEDALESRTRYLAYAVCGARISNLREISHIADSSSLLLWCLLSRRRGLLSNANEWRIFLSYWSPCASLRLNLFFLS